MPKGIPNKPKITPDIGEKTIVPNIEQEPEFATKEEISELKSLVVKLYDSIESKKQEEEKKEDQDVLPEANPIKRAWRSTVDSILGPDFGINVSYTGGGGMIFRIIVPEKKSNAGDAYFKLYKNDVRSKVIALGSNETDAIKNWCLKIKRNITIKPRIQP